MRELLQAAAGHAADHLERRDRRPIRPDAAYPELRERAGRPLPDGPSDPRAVLDELVELAEPGLIGMGSARFFGWVIGGALPAALAADWMTAVWDQNAGMSVTPAAAALEDVAGGWLLDVLGLPAHASFAMVTGCQAAHTVCLAAARHRVLAAAGHDVERDGLAGAPRIRVLAGAERHATIDRALRLLGLGAGCVEPVAVDDRGALRADALGAALDGAAGPLVVCAQAGHVSTGAVDPLREISELAHAAGAWVHVDGAFGLWGRASADPARRALLDGAELADSWATDAHKWLNVPYDCGLAFVADTAAHRGAMGVRAVYLPAGDDEEIREPMDWNPEFSRRARGLPVWAALRSLGRAGVAELVDRLCDCAALFAERLGAAPGAEVLAHELNQVLVRFGDDATTDAVLAAVERDGTCFMSGTTWRGMRCMRISVCNWQTTAEDVERSVDAVLTPVA